MTSAPPPPAEDPGSDRTAEPPPGAPMVLIVDDIPSLRAIYQVYLSDAGFPARLARSGTEALKLFRETDAAIVLLDMFLPDRDGLDLMRQMLAIRPTAAIVVVTADRSIDLAVAAIRAGAQDFLVKPVTQDRLVAAIQNARATIRTPRIPPAPGPDQRPLDLISNSPAMREVFTRIRAAAQSMAPILVWGENGTGKRLCARTIHDLSPRAAGPFVTLDCAALPAERFGIELFGKTGTDCDGHVLPQTRGAAAQADGGTLFLNNVDQLDPAAQPVLLQFLESPLLRHEGSGDGQQANVRVIAATSSPPRETLRAGHLREDLFHRLHVVPIRMPPLRERRDDIVSLAETMLRRYAALEGRGFRKIGPAAAAVLRAHDWPGNVRQLMNVLHAVTVLHDGEHLTLAMLPEAMQPHAAADPARRTPLARGNEPPVHPDVAALAGMPLAQVERLVIEAALARHRGSVPAAATELDIAVSTIYRKISQWRRE